MPRPMAAVLRNANVWCNSAGGRVTACHGPLPQPCSAWWLPTIPSPVGVLAAGTNASATCSTGELTKEQQTNTGHMAWCAAADSVPDREAAAARTL